MILASGVIERPLVFGNNDTPGVYTVSAAQTYLNRYGVLLGDKIVICGNNDEIYLAARDLAQVGAEVIVADVRSRSKVPDYLAKQVKVHLGYRYCPSEAATKGQVSGVELIDLKSGKLCQRGLRSGASSGGLSPTVHLYCHDTSRPLWDAEKMAFVVPEKYENCKPTVCNVGAVTGAKTWQQTLAQTGDTPCFFADRGIQANIVMPKVVEEKHQAMELAVRLPDGMPAGKGAKAFVDYQNDVTAEDIKITIQENYRHIEHVKRYTAFGFGTEQGKLSSVNSFILTAEAMGVPVECQHHHLPPGLYPVSLVRLGRFGCR